MLIFTEHVDGMIEIGEGETSAVVHIIKVTPSGKIRVGVDAEKSVAITRGDLIKGFLESYGWVQCSGNSLKWYMQSRGRQHQYTCRQALAICREMEAEFAAEREQSKTRRSSELTQLEIALKEHAHG